MLDAFSRALPRTYHNICAPDGTSVALAITGEAGGTWLLRREGEQWRQYVLEADDVQPTSSVTLDQEMAWRLFTRGVDGDTAREQASIAGDRALGLHLFETVSMLV